MSSLNYWLLLGAVGVWGLAGWVFVILYHRLTGRCIALLERYATELRKTHHYEV